MYGVGEAIVRNRGFDELVVDSFLGTNLNLDGYGRGDQALKSMYRDVMKFFERWIVVIAQEVSTHSAY